MKSYLKTENLAVGYHGKPLIEEVSLCVQRGRIVTLIGPNGSGKSTILKTIIGQLPELSGAVERMLGERDRLRAQNDALGMRIFDLRRAGADDLPRCGQLRALPLHGKTRRAAGRGSEDR